MFLPIIFLYDVSLSESVLKSLKKTSPLIITAIIWLIIHQLVISSSSEVIQYTFQDNSILASPSVLDQKATALGIFARYYLKAFYPYEMAYDYSFSHFPMIHLYSIYAILGILFF